MSFLMPENAIGYNNKFASRNICKPTLYKYVISRCAKLNDEVTQKEAIWLPFDRSLTKHVYNMYIVHR